MKILIVDDNMEDRTILRHYLNQLEGEILEAANGVDGLTAARFERPDLIISDALMPDADGFEFLREVRRSPEICDTPFIFYSAVYTGCRDEDLAMSLGADAFLSKPLEPEVFLRQLNNLLEGFDRSKKRGVSELLVEDEMYLKKYSQVVAARLEEKVRELELANRELTESENRFHNLFNSMRDVVIVADLSRTITDANQPALWEVFGYETAEVVGKNGDFIFGSREAFEMTGKEFFDLQEPRKGKILEAEYRRKNGDLFTGELYAMKLVDNQGSPVGNIGVIRDITKRKRVEADLRLQSAALQAAADAVVITDHDGTIAWINPAFTALTGYGAEEAIGKNSRDLVRSGVHDQAFYKQLWDTLLDGEVWRGEITNRRKNGTLYAEEQTITPVKDPHGDLTHFIGIKRDLTEQGKLEAQLRHAQKMESIGTLAGGIAHDFNNILTGIIGYGNLALMTMTGDDPQRVRIQHMLEASDRAAHLTKELLLFSRKQALDKKKVDLNLVVGQMEKFLRRVIGDDIEIKTAIGDTKLPVLADSYQIEQVLMNLATNARDSMLRGGTLVITTEAANLDEDFIAAYGYGKPGTYALITFSDNGAGMDEETQKRIFEPFFTTKDVGKGTGLGLAVVYGIIKQHDGNINVYSESDRGTTFRIYLPLIADNTENVTTLKQKEVPARGTETVLIAEDDDLVREITKNILTEFGYTVIVAVDGEEALRKFKEHADSIQLLLFDLIMPKMSGKDASDEIHKIKPGLKTIFASGYAPDMIQQKASLCPSIHLIQKPTPPHDLLKMVRDVLDGVA